MSKQSKIRKGMEEYVSSGVEQGLPVGLIVGEILSFLDSQGVVRKVKCPDCFWWEAKPDEAWGGSPCYSCNSTGYIYEPLIEEGE